MEFSFYFLLKCEVFHFIDSKLSSEDEVKTLLSQWGAWLRKLAEAESGREREREKKKTTPFTGPFFVALRALLFASCAVLLFVVPLPCAAGLLSPAASLLVASLSNRWRNNAEH